MTRTKVKNFRPLVCSKENGRIRTYSPFTVFIVVKWMLPNYILEIKEEFFINPDTVKNMQTYFTDTYKEEDEDKILPKSIEEYKRETMYHV